MVAGYLAITIAAYNDCIRRAVLAERERCAEILEYLECSYLADAIRREPNPPGLAESSDQVSPG